MGSGASRFSSEGVQGLCVRDSGFRVPQVGRMGNVVTDAYNKPLTTTARKATGMEIPGLAFRI